MNDSVNDMNLSLSFTTAHNMMQPYAGETNFPVTLVPIITLPNSLKSPLFVLFYLIAS